MSAPVVCCWWSCCWSWIQLSERYDSHSKHTHIHTHHTERSTYLDCVEILACVFLRSWFSTHRHPINPPKTLIEHVRERDISIKWYLEYFIQSFIPPLYTHNTSDREAVWEKMLHMVTLLFSKEKVLRFVSLAYISLDRRIEFRVRTLGKWTPG